MRKILHLGLEGYAYFPEDEVVHRPILHTQSCKISEEILAQVKNFSAVIVTSKEAVKYFLILHGDRLNKDAKIISIGSKTTDAIRQAGFVVHYQSNYPTQEGIIDLIKKEDLQTHSFLLIKSNLSRNKLDLFLKNNDLRFFSLTSYKTLINKNFEKIELNVFDAIFFTSPSCIKFFFKIYAKVPDHIQFITMGPITMESLRKINKKYLNNVELIIGR